MQFKLNTIISLVSIAVTGINAQSSTAYTDPVSGITFQRFYTSSYKFSFGMALPESPTNEFIGQIVAPINGWGGVSFGGGMLNNLLLTGWKNGNSIVHGFRMTGSYELPSLYAGSTLTPKPVLTPICNTGVNSTHWTLTFICTNCNNWENTYGEVAGVDLAGDFAVMGWAIGADTPSNPTDPGSAILQHTAFGQYGMILSSARSSKYNTWKSCTSGGSPTSSTRPSSTSAAPTGTPVPKYGQCGGIGWKGSTTCASGSTCKKLNDHYSQASTNCIYPSKCYLLII